MRSRIDIAGQRFGYLIAIRDVGRDIRGARTWECKCDCGKIVKIKGASLISGNTMSCGCSIRPDMIGKRFGRLLVISLIGVAKRKRIWECRCDCGKITTRPTWTLTTGHTTSCGCLDAERRFGESNPRWKGGASFKPYCDKWTEKIREEIRDKFGRKCYLCPKTEKENGRKLAVHHCDYNKGQGCGQKWNLIPLCHKCHNKTNNDRHYYFNLLANYWAMNPDINLF